MEIQPGQLNRLIIIRIDRSRVKMLSSSVVRTTRMRLNLSLVRAFYPKDETSHWLGHTKKARRIRNNAIAIRNAQDKIGASANVLLSDKNGGYYDDSY